jgi:hypothetical protein
MMVMRKNHERMTSGICNIFGATLDVISKAVVNMPASFERKIFVFMFTPVSVIAKATFIRPKQSHYRDRDCFVAIAPRDDD